LDCLVLPLHVLVIGQQQQPLRRKVVTRHYRMVQMVMRIRQPQQLPELVTMLPNFFVDHLKQLARLLKQPLRRKKVNVHLQTPHPHRLLPLLLVVQRQPQRLGGTEVQRQQLVGAHVQKKQLAFAQEQMHWQHLRSRHDHHQQVPELLTAHVEQPQQAIVDSIRHIHLVWCHLHQISISDEPADPLRRNGTQEFFLSGNAGPSTGHIQYLKLQPWLEDRKEVTTEKGLGLRFEILIRKFVMKDICMRKKKRLKVMFLGCSKMI